MNGELHELWVYLAATPLLGLTVTLVAYQGAARLQVMAGGSPLLNPVLLSVMALVALLAVTGIDYQSYFDGAQFVHFLLGPATVALAVPLYRQLSVLRRAWFAVAAAVLAGSLTAVTTAVGVAWLLGGSPVSLVSLAPKSVTTPIAMGIAEELGGLPSLTAVLVILTGVIGAMLGSFVLNAVKVSDWRARGLAVGVAAHGIGTARALQVNDQAGAFAGLAMGLNGVATALLLPLLAELLLQR